MADNSIVQPVKRELYLSRQRISALTIRLGGDARFKGLAGILVIAVLLLVDKGPTLLAFAAPSGADPGNWLSLAWGLTGQGARLSDWAYPPFTFILLRGLLLVFDPLLALKILGMFTWVALGWAFFFVLQSFTPRLPFLVRLGLGLMFIFCGYNGEIFAWGGYPQLLGMAFLVLAIPFSELWLRGGHRRDGLVAISATGGVIFTHHMLAAIFPLLLGLVVVWTYFQVHKHPQLFFQRLKSLFFWDAVISLAALPVYWKYFHLLAGNPANPGGFTLGSILLIGQYLFRESEWLWFTLAVVAGISLWILNRRLLVAGSAAFILGSLLGFLILKEIRLLQILIAGICYGLALLSEAIWIRSPFHTLARVKRAVLVMGIGTVLLITLPGGQQQYVQASAYYRVVDNQILSGLDWLRANSAPGDRIAASRSQPDLLGWWVEGLAQRPAIYATDLRWLTFSQEKSYAMIANEIFNSATSPERAGTLIYANRIRYILIDRELQLSALTSLIDRGVLSPVFENQRVMILKVANSRRTINAWTIHTVN